MTIKEVRIWKVSVIIIAGASIVLLVVSLFRKQWIMAVAMALCSLTQIYNYRAWNKKEKELNKK